MIMMMMLIMMMMMMIMTITIIAMMMIIIIIIILFLSLSYSLQFFFLALLHVFLFFVYFTRTPMCTLCRLHDLCQLETVNSHGKQISSPSVSREGAPCGTGMREHLIWRTRKGNLLSYFRRLFDRNDRNNMSLPL